MAFLWSWGKHTNERVQSSSNTPATVAVVSCYRICSLDRHIWVVSNQYYTMLNDTRMCDSENMLTIYNIFEKTGFSVHFSTVWSSLQQHLVAIGGTATSSILDSGFISFSLLPPWPPFTLPIQGGFTVAIRRLAVTKLVSLLTLL